MRFYDVTSFGEELRKIRSKEKIMLKDMAEKINVNASHLCNIEHGRQNVSPDLVYKLKLAYNLTDEYTQLLMSKATESSNFIIVNFSEVEEFRKKVAVEFFQEFATIDEDKLNRISDILNSEGE